MTSHNPPPPPPPPCPLFPPFPPLPPFLPPSSISLIVLTTEEASSGSGRVRPRAEVLLLRSQTALRQAYYFPLLPPPLLPLRSPLPSFPSSLPASRSCVRHFFTTGPPLLPSLLALPLSSFPTPPPPPPPPPPSSYSCSCSCSPSLAALTQ